MFRYYYDEIRNACVVVDPLCKAWDKKGGCTECFEGFSVFGSKCSAAAQNTVTNIRTSIASFDANCNVYNGGACTECAYRYVLISGLCKAVDVSCKTWNSVGACTSCFDLF